MIKTTRSSSEDAERDLAEELQKAFRAFKSIRWRPDAGHEARHAELHILRCLMEDQNGGGRGLRAGDLGAQLRVKPPTITQMVDTLESRGLVARVRDDSDRRVVRVRLSESGEALARERGERMLQDLTLLVRALGREESRAFAKALRISAEFLAKRRPGCRAGCGSPACLGNGEEELR